MVNNGFMRFHSHGDTQNSSFMTEHPIKIDDLGLSPLWGISIYVFFLTWKRVYIILHYGHIMVFIWLGQGEVSGNEGARKSNG